MRVRRGGPRFHFGCSGALLPTTALNEGLRFKMINERKGTITTFNPVMNPAFDEVVYNKPIV